MWLTGSIVDAKTGIRYNYEMKRFEEPSHFGIENGRISKLYIRKEGERDCLCCYDRGWDIAVAGEITAIYKQLLEDFN